METEKILPKYDNNDLNETQRKRGGLTLGIVGGLCCAGPLAVAGIISIPTLGIFGGIGLFFAVVYRNMKSYFVK